MIDPSLRIGYSLGSPGLKAPSDRRRFPHYAHKRNIPFVPAKATEVYDVVILNQAADLSVWSRYRRGETKIVYDAVDSYLSIRRSDLAGKLRGTWKFVTGQSRRLEVDYWSSIQRMASRADAVVCSTEEQRQLMRAFCPNVHVILDFQNSDIRRVKTDHSSEGPWKFMWEGLGCRNVPLPMLRRILEGVSQEHEVELHMVTDLVYRRFGNLHGKSHMTDDVRKKCGRFARSVHLHSWSPSTLAAVSSICDLALIPLDLDDPFQRGKPENKLLLFWRLGMPTITSATPAYQLAMERAGLEMTCSSTVEWEATIVKYMTDEPARMHAAEKGRLLAEACYGEERMLAKWDAVFASM